MARPRFVSTDVGVYHVCSRVNNRDWYSVPLTEVWSVYEKLLIRTVERYEIVVHAFVLMANHFHLITSTPKKNLPAAMRYLLTEASREIGRRSGRINHIFGGRYRWSLLWGPVELAYVYKYVLRNPIRAGASQRVENYDFSTFAQLLQNRCAVPVVDGLGRLWELIPREPAARALWINTVPGSGTEILITTALRRFEFQLPSHARATQARTELRATYGVEPVDNLQK